MGKSISQREIVEETYKAIDYTLQGMMNILTTLLKKFPMLYSKLQNGEIITSDALLSVFQIPISITKELKTFPPKCKSKETISAAFELIKQLYESDDNIKKNCLIFINKNLRFNYIVTQFGGQI